MMMNHPSGSEDKDGRAIAEKPLSDLGNASASQLKRIMVDAGNVRYASIQVSTVGAPFASAFTVRAQVDSLCLGEILTAHVLGPLSENSLLALVPLKHPSGVWVASAASWVTDFGGLRCLSMDARGKWASEAWEDSCAERTIRLQFQGAGAPVYVGPSQSFGPENL